LYLELIARQHGVAWNRRAYNRADWNATDIVNRSLSAATSCIYGLAEAAVLAAGYAPAIGFLGGWRRVLLLYVLILGHNLVRTLNCASRCLRWRSTGPIPVP
jgi:hypothetical protein